MNWFWLIVSSLVRFLLFGFSLLNDSTGLWNFVDVQTETRRDWDISWMSRPRLIETEKFLGCRDRDSSRLGKSMDVETETSRDWAKDVDTETPSRLSLISGLGPQDILCRWSPTGYRLLVWRGQPERGGEHLDHGALPCYGWIPGKVKKQDLQGSQLETNRGDTQGNPRVHTGADVQLGAQFRKQSTLHTYSRPLAGGPTQGGICSGPEYQTE